MHIEGSQFMLDKATCFYNTLHIDGWFDRAGDRLVAVDYLDEGAKAVISEVDLPHGGVATLGPDRGFSVQVLQLVPGIAASAMLRFVTEQGWSTEVLLTDLSNEALPGFRSKQLTQHFMDDVNAMDGAVVLDLGGRPRSGNSLRSYFTTEHFVVFDVLAGTGVDVVGDAHELARFFPPAHFDAILCIAVFEHLMMPWTVVTQMNAVLKPGGLGMVISHQTTGLHDMPWDFWRYSDTAWDSLFNAATGFEIVERAMDWPAHIIPFFWTPAGAGAENTAGYLASAVMVRKIGPCRMEWPLRVADINPTMYPEGELPPS